MNKVYVHIYFSFLQVTINKAVTASVVTRKDSRGFLWLEFYVCTDMPSANLQEIVAEIPYPQRGRSTDYFQLFP